MNRPQQYDLVVAGATPAGILAAIGAARRGLSVALVDPLPEAGQMLTNGLCVLDATNTRLITGLLREFTTRVAAYHKEHYADQECYRQNAGAPRHGVADGLGFEPKIAALVVRDMIAGTPGLAFFPRHELVGAVMDGRRCIGVRARPIEGPGFDPRWAFRDDTPDLARLNIEFLGRAVIDATYEGDIAAWAGVPFAVGREARSRGEPHNGHIMCDYLTGRAALDAGWLPETFLPGGTGAADPKVMAYSVRYVAKCYGRSSGPHRLEKPPGYDPAEFRPTQDMRRHWQLPNGKVFVNLLNGGNDTPGPVIAKFPNGTRADRRAVIDAVYGRARRHLYYLQTEMDFGEWGLADDEFPENGHWPYCIYVREARRIVGMATMTEADVHRWLPRPGDSIFDGLPGDRSRAPLHRDGIAVGEFDIDSRPCDVEPSQSYQASGEGGFLLSSIRSPFQVPYGCMVPRSVEGLLVPCAVSASHVAFSVVRMEPVWAQIGEAAGIAAALALAQGSSFQSLNPAHIQEERLKGGGQIYYYNDLDASHSSFVSVQRLSVRGAARGFPDWSFRADRPITRGEWAQMTVAALDLWPSVTANHFDDVPPTHPAFVAFETLYDHGARTGKRVVAFERYQRVYCDDKLGYRIYVRPDADLPRDDAIRMLALLCDRTEAAVRLLAPFPGDGGTWLSRGHAARLLDAVSGSR